VLGNEYAPCDWFANQINCSAARPEQRLFMKVLVRLSQKSVRTVASICVGFTPFVIAGNGCLL
jgi:hypothetical protein